MRVLLAAALASVFLFDVHGLPAQVVRSGRFDPDRAAFILRVAVVPLGFGWLFYHAASFERMPGWPWAIGSIALSYFTMLFGGVVLVIVVQVALFIAMWVYNTLRRPKWVG